MNYSWTKSTESAHLEYQFCREDAKIMPTNFGKDIVDKINQSVKGLLSDGATDISMTFESLPVDRDTNPDESLLLLTIRAERPSK